MTFRQRAIEDAISTLERKNEILRAAVMSGDAIRIEVSAGKLCDAVSRACAVLRRYYPKGGGQ